MTVHDTIARMLSAHLDGELTQADDQRVRLHLEDCPECRRVHADLLTLRDETAKLRFVEAREEQVESFARRVTTRAPQALGWLLLVAGALVWLGYAGYHFLTAPDLLSWERLTVAAMAIGGALLLASVVLQRLLELPGDRYRGVKR